MAEHDLSVKSLTEMCIERGYLAKQLYAIFTTRVKSMDEVMQNLPDHLAFQVELERDGVLFAAGPHWTDDEKRWDGDGLVVIRAKSLDEANAIAARDPMHARGVRRYRVRPWLINEGTMTVKLDFSTRTLEVL
jgi:uncharacterized protein